MATNDTYRGKSPKDYLKEIFSNPKDLWTIPNILVYIRIALSALLLAVYLLGVYKDVSDGSYGWGVYLDDPNRVQIEGYFAAAIILTCGFTDFLDGYIARKFNQRTQLGVFLDPFADKLLQLFIIVGVTYRWSARGDAMLTVAVWALLGMLLAKEGTMFFANIWVYAKRGVHFQKASWYGKASTAILYLTMGILLFFVNSFSDKAELAIQILCWICFGALGIAAILYGVQYIDMYRHPQNYLPKDQKPDSKTD